MYQSTKIIDGFSTCFRQWRAKTSHCRFIHGYSIRFKLTFQAAKLDDRNWVQDFGFTKSKLMIEPNGISISIKDWFKYMFDHTTIVAEDDPMLELFKDYSAEADCEGVFDLRILPNVGCEAFAKYVFDFISENILEGQSRVSLISVECIENENNSAIYKD
jgi:6-pyruvoyltetrahydropterin/6-carboxytetrahydropterin synthase